MTDKPMLPPDQPTPPGYCAVCRHHRTHHREGAGIDVPEGRCGVHGCTCVTFVEPPPSLTRYLDGAETPNSTTLMRALYWDDHTSPLSDPLQVLQECLSRFGVAFESAPRKLYLHPAALRAVLSHPTVLHEMRDAEDPGRWLERFLRLPPDAVETMEAMGASVLILGDSEAERYAIFNVVLESSP